MAPTRRSDAELIAAAYLLDVSSVTDGRYRPSLFKVAIYAIDDNYFCVPRGRPLPPLPDGYGWQPWKESFGDMIYISD